MQGLSESLGRADISVDTLEPNARNQSRRLILLAVALITVLAPINSTMITVALPAIRLGFNSDVANVSWLVITYLVTMASLQPLAGKLGDHWGRRRIILISLLYFAVASFLAGTAVNLTMLIVFRIQQAVAIALALPNGAALIREVSPESHRARSFGLIGAITSLAAASGPAIGGLLVGVAGWRAIFYVNIPILIPALIIGWKQFPKSKGQTERQSFDYLGSVLLFVTLVGTVILLTQSRRGLATGILISGGFLVAACFILLLWWERRQTDPVIKPGFFRNRSFAAACAAVSFSNMAMYTTFLTLPILLSVQLGWTSGRVGLVLTALAGTSVIAAPAGGYLADRFGRKWPTAVGMLLGATGAVMLFFGGQNATVSGIMVALGTMGVGLGLASAGMQTAIVESVGPGEAGVASGLFSTSRYLGSIIGSSLLSMLLISDGEKMGEFNSVFLLIVIASVASVIAGLAIHNRPAEHWTAAKPA